MPAYRVSMQVKHTTLIVHDPLFDSFQVKDIHIHKEMFSIQNGLLTPTLKAKRPELKEYFKMEIEQLYSNISM